MSKFKEVKVVDNFYQNSLFFPMPTVAISTLAEDGITTIGAYSLVFPYYIAGKDCYAMLLECRNSSNTAQNILRTGKCALNFIKDDKKSFKELVRLGFPGKTPQEKMKDCTFDLIRGQAEGERPLILKDAYQVIECTWMEELENGFESKEHIGQLEGVEGPYKDFNGITSKFGCHFILKIDNILMKPKYYNAIINGVNRDNFPNVPVDYGYRDSKNFWYTKFKKPIAAPIPKEKGISLDTVKYAASRIDPEVKFTDEACSKLVKVPRVFLNTVLKGCVAWAKENNVTLITEKEMEIIQDKRNKEKK